MNFDSPQISALSFRRAYLRLEPPRPLAREIFTGREIVYVEADVHTEDGVGKGVGEAAPLPAWGTETLEKTLEALSAAQKRLENAEEPIEMGVLLEDLEDLPTARFALETAGLDAIARQRGVPLRALLSPEAARDVVAVHASIPTGTPAEAFEAAEKAAALGYESLKVEVGSTTFDVDFDRLSAIREAVGDSARLRLDAGGGWSAVYALHFMDILQDFDIEYVQQPCPAGDLAGLGWLRQRSSVPIAAAESCYPFKRARRLVEWKIVDVMVIKPMVLGGLQRTMQIAEEAALAEIDVVLASSAESGVGRMAAAQLAAALPKLERPCGFATGEWFQQDLADAPSPEDGELALGDGPGTGVEIDWKRLEDR